MPLEKTWSEFPWEHPDWYDLHDTVFTAGPEREPEHYCEWFLALPPLDADDHLIDVGAGTGKLALLIAKGYPWLNRVTLIDPNSDKLERAQAQLAAALPQVVKLTICAALGQGAQLPQGEATVVTVGSVLMPAMEIQGGSLGDGLEWLRRFWPNCTPWRNRALGWVDVVTWWPHPATPCPCGPVRRLTLIELAAEFERAGFVSIECSYRFRNRVVVRAQRPRR